MKRLHPDTPLLLGGYSATYYHREIMERYPRVDFILRGDSCEEPLHRLLASLDEGSLSAIPNLCWRDGGRTRVNPLRHVPASLQGLRFDYRVAARMAWRYRDFQSPLPFNRWRRYPISALFTCRGCASDCTFCGGASTALKDYCGRRHPAFSPAVQLATDLAQATSLLKGPVFLLGDLRQMGEKELTRFLELAAELKLKNEVVVELFRPAGDDYFRRIAAAFPRFNVEFSPDSHEAAVRKAMGKDYADAGIEESIGASLANGCQRFDVFFMSGLSRQSAASVMETVRYCERLLASHGGEGRLHPYLSLLSPFVDPGSPIFRRPKRFGYRLVSRSLEGHRELLLRPAWTERLNYRTSWMSRAQLGDVTLGALAALAHVKESYGLLGRGEARDAVRRYEEVAGLDSLLRGGASITGELKRRIREVNARRIHERFELEWGGRGIRPWGALKALVGRGAD